MRASPTSSPKSTQWISFSRQTFMSGFASANCCCISNSHVLLRIRFFKKTATKPAIAYTDVNCLTCQPSKNWPKQAPHNHQKPNEPVLVFTADAHVNPSNHNFRQEDFCLLLLLPHKTPHCLQIWLHVILGLFKHGPLENIGQTSAAHSCRHIKTLYPSWQQVIHHLKTPNGSMQLQTSCKGPPVHASAGPHFSTGENDFCPPLVIFVGVTILLPLKLTQPMRRHTLCPLHALRQASCKSSTLRRFPTCRSLRPHEPFKISDTC